MRQGGISCLPTPPKPTFREARRASSAVSQPLQSPRSRDGIVGLHYRRFGIRRPQPLPPLAPRRRHGPRRPGPHRRSREEGFGCRRHARRPRGPLGRRRAGRWDERVRCGVPLRRVAREGGPQDDGGDQRAGHGQRRGGGQARRGAGAAARRHGGGARERTGTPAGRGGRELPDSGHVGGTVQRDQGQGGEDRATGERGRAEGRGGQAEVHLGQRRLVDPAHLCRHGQVRAAQVVRRGEQQDLALPRGQLLPRHGARGDQGPRRRRLLPHRRRGRPVPGLHDADARRRRRRGAARVGVGAAAGRGEPAAGADGAGSDCQRCQGEEGAGVRQRGVRRAGYGGPGQAARREDVTGGFGLTCAEYMLV